MTAEQDMPRVVSATREIAASPERIFELIADPSQQPGWDGNDNLSEAQPGQRVRQVGDVFTMTLTTGSVRQNHVVEFEEARRIAWHPSEVPGHIRWPSDLAKGKRRKIRLRKGRDLVSSLIVREGPGNRRKHLALTQEAEPFLHFF